MTISTPDDAALFELAVQVGGHLLVSRRVLVTAESCTGGWIGKAMTDAPGSSAWFAGGAIAYSNSLKQTMLAVRAATLAENGAVSEAVVREMAQGALTALSADVAIAVSGIAGPDGGTVEKPLGTVWFAWSWRTATGVQTKTDMRVFAGDREAVRRQTVWFALTRVMAL